MVTPIVQQWIEDGRRDPDAFWARAAGELPWQSAVAAFRRRGASVVVGTLVETLGRQAAVMVELLSAELWSIGARPETVGELLRSVRRELVASGHTLGLSVVAFGDSDRVVAAA